MSIDYSSFAFPKPSSKAKTKTQIKKKSKKLAKKERERFSIITNKFNECFICETKIDDDTRELHEVFRGRNRQKSIKWGLVIPICDKCHKYITTHRNEKLEEYARKIFIKKYSEKMFIEEFK